MPTIRQVAKACGVSPMTVSFVLNNKRDQVSEETRERVLRTVREMGYRPAAKEQIAPGHVLTLGVVAGVAGDSLIEPGYYNAVLNAILVAADRGGHNVTLFTNSLLHSDPHQSLRVYCDGRCDGLLVLAPQTGSALVTALHERGVPFVLIGDTGDNPTDSCVDVDNVAEGRRATEYLLGLGHRRVAFIGGPEWVRSMRSRGQGYRQAMAAAGLAPDEAGAWDAPDDQTGTLTAIRALFARPAGERPTAAFAWNDGTAFTAMRLAAERGLRVPADLSVIGFDDDHRAPASDPPLTTMRQPYKELGAQAVETLVGLVRREFTTPVHRLRPTELVERASAGAAPPE